MSEVTKEHLDESIERVISLLQDFSTRVDQRFEDAAKRVDERFDALEIRFDNQAARLDLQGGLIQVGTRWTKRMTDWSEKVNVALEAKDKQIAELSDRVRKLEDSKS